MIEIGSLVMIIAVVAGAAVWDGVKYIARRVMRNRERRAQLEILKDQFRANERRRARGDDQ